MLKRHVTSLGHETVAQTCPVDKQRQLITLAHGTDGLQLGQCIDRTHLGGKSDVNHAGEHHVLIGDIGIEVVEPLIKLSGIHLAVVCG